VKDVEAGRRHSMFRTSNHKIFACGDANQGQLGLGENLTIVHFPTSIAQFEGVEIKQIACGKYHTLFLTEIKREVFTCGANDEGQLGLASSKQTKEIKNVFTPTRINNLSKRKIEQISAW
jgi:E3 ubiquitin-protein ligase HERC4